MLQNRKKRFPEEGTTSWKALSLEEKKRQFRELVRSPYWHFLPDEIQQHLKKQIFLHEEG